MSSPGAFGVDKLTLFTPDFQVQDLSPARGWTVHRRESPDTPETPPLLLDGTGTVVHANKAYAKGDRVTFDLDSRGLRVDLNPSKGHHPWHLSPDLGGVTGQIRHEAERHGLRFDVDTLRLSRLDLARQAEMPELPSTYGHAFTLLRGKRMKSAIYPDGARFSNGQRQAVFYSKRAELLHRHKEGYGCPSRLLRAEARFMTHKATARATGLTYLPDLVRAHPDKLLEAYRDFMARDVFRLTGDGQQEIIPFEGLSGFLRDCRENYRNGIDRFLSIRGAEALFIQFGGFEGFVAFLEEAGVNRTTAWKVGKRSAEGIERGRLFNPANKTTADLVGELRETFL